VILSDQILKSSVHDVTSFAKSNLWEDMITLITERIDFLHEELEHSLEYSDIRYVQGQISTLRNMLELTDKLADAVIEQQKQNTEA